MDKPAGSPSLDDKPELPQSEQDMGDDLDTDMAHDLTAQPTHSTNPSLV